MINRQEVQAPGPGSSGYSSARGLDVTYQRLLIEATHLGQLMAGWKSQVDTLRAGWPGNAGMKRALTRLEFAIEELTPLWTWAKHRDLTTGFVTPDLCYSEAMAWLKMNDPANATPGKAASLSRRTRAFARSAYGGFPDWEDRVVELLHGRRVRTYFLCMHLRMVYTYGWSRKTAKIAEAQMAIKEWDALSGPVTVPEVAAPRPRKRRRER